MTGTKTIRFRKAWLNEHGRLTPDGLSALRKMLSAGKSRAEIASTMHLTHTAISTRAEEMGFNFKKKQRPRVRRRAAYRATA